MITKTFLILITSFVLSQAQKITEDLVNFYRPFESFVELKGGTFLMGINDRNGANYEYPQRLATVKPFRIMLYPVTMASFQKFKLNKKKYRTHAEIYESSWVFNQLKNPFGKIDIYKSLHDHDSLIANDQDMSLVLGARWNRPTGGNSSIYNYLNLPTVHVSFNDAFTYCAWKGMRLPNEMEWEFAARGGLKEKDYPWGEEWQLNRTNLWQGNFPYENQLRDGFFGMSPVDAYRSQNNYGIYDLIGNVWEWTSTIKPRGANEDTTRNESKIRVLKGGSFLNQRDGSRNSAVHPNIRISARIGISESYTGQNVGFRCVQSISGSEKAHNFKNNESFRIFRLRAPVHHHLKKEESHQIVKVHVKTEL